MAGYGRACDSVRTNHQAAAQSLNSYFHGFNRQTAPNKKNPRFLYFSHCTAIHVGANSSKTGGICPDYHKAVCTELYRAGMCRWAIAVGSPCRSNIVQCILKESIIPVANTPENRVAEVPVVWSDCLSEPPPLERVRRIAHMNGKRFRVVGNRPPFSRRTDPGLLDLWA